MVIEAPQVAVRPLCLPFCQGTSFFLIRTTIGFAAISVIGTLLIGCQNTNHLARDTAHEGLEGTWEVTSVYRDGQPEATQVGARLRFLDDEVTFYPGGKLIEPGS